MHIYTYRERERERDIEERKFIGQRCSCGTLPSVLLRYNKSTVCFYVCFSLCGYTCFFGCVLRYLRLSSPYFPKGRGTFSHATRPTGNLPWPIRSNPPLFPSHVNSRRSSPSGRILVRQYSLFLSLSLSFSLSTLSLRSVRR